MKKNPFKDIDIAKLRAKFKPTEPENSHSYTNFSEADNDKLKSLQDALPFYIKKRPKKKAFLVTFKDRTDLAYITFALTRGKARWYACKYFRDLLIPEFQRDKGYSAQLRFTVTKRVQNFDKYAEKGRVPIPILMKELNFKFPCSICGKELFSLKDYEAGRCFVLEGEENLNEFTEGIILCYNCYKKYMG